MEVVEELGSSDISHSSNGGEKYFAEVIGHIEDILMSNSFGDLHTEFMEAHWHQFVEDEENKLEYMDIFQKYIDVIEKHIEDELIKAISTFKMVEFTHLLRDKSRDLDGEIFEILSTFSDFMLFKEKFLDYKAMKEGRMIDLSNDFSITKYECCHEG